MPTCIVRADSAYRTPPAYKDLVPIGSAHYALRKVDACSRYISAPIHIRYQIVDVRIYANAHLEFSLIICRRGIMSLNPSTIDKPTRM